MLVKEIQLIKQSREEDFSLAIKHLNLLEDKLSELQIMDFYFKVSFEVRNNIIDCICNFDFAEIVSDQELNCTLDFLSNGNDEDHLAYLTIAKVKNKFCKESYDEDLNLSSWVPEGSNKAEFVSQIIKETRRQIDEYSGFIALKKLAYQVFFQRVIGLNLLEVNFRESAFENILKTPLTPSQRCIGSLVDKNVVNKCKDLIKL